MTASITPEIYRSMGLNDSEYALILQMMGREPSLTELGMFAVMWSEHCGYKYSRPVLAYFKKYKEAMEGSGLENAGVVDIGDGLGVTMKIESHNHPSAVEPYQGAATGVGGIIRDILTMGARPIAGLNSLRFGPIEGPENARNRFLFEHVVEGIGGYGNCVGVPTVGGEVSFHPRYSGNPLVNAMCVGILPLDKITTAAASGVGNPVIYIGSATGKDGIHGATFASEGLDEDSDAKRPNVQIGDPFAEKQLIEATLEALDTGAIVAIQDMGAAGLTCSTIEMASKGGVGMEVNLDLVPMRESDMSAYELMLSESQERMLAVAQEGREEEVLAVCRKWGLRACVIGFVIEERVVRVTRHGEVAAELDPWWLADHCPTYTTEIEEPEYFRAAGQFSINDIPEVDPNEALLKLLRSPNIASKRWVFRQYDQQVQTQTALSSGQSDAAVLAPRGTRKGLALKVDGNARYVYWDPYVGGQRAVVEAARNVACSGARPVAVTDGLNFGNPQKPHVYWQFERAVKGVANAAEAMGTPVISGNVSFYNESELGEVLPTPLIGMLGVLGDIENRVGLALQGTGQIGLLSIPTADDPCQGLGASEYLSAVHGIENGRPTPINLEDENRLNQLLADLAENKVVTAMHDVSDGGLAVALAEMAIAGQVGVQVTLVGQGRDDAKLFGEQSGRVLVAFLPENQQQLQELAAQKEIQFQMLGQFAPEYAEFHIGDRLRLGLGEITQAHERPIQEAMQG